MKCLGEPIESITPHWHSDSEAIDLLKLERRRKRITKKKSALCLSECPHTPSIGVVWAAALFLSNLEKLKITMTCKFRRFSKKIIKKIKMKIKNKNDEYLMNF